MRTLGTKFYIIISMIMSSCGHFSYADDANVKISISGEITFQPCVVNGGNPINVDFGQIPLDKVSDSSSRVVKNISLSCSYYQSAPYVKITGTPLTNNSDGNVLATSIKDFGIALYQGEGVGTKLLIGEGAGIGYKINAGLTNPNAASSTFTFTAAPYKNGSAQLSSGAFSATASMSIIYN